MKKIIYSLFYILIAYSTITCSEDFLDRKPLGRYTIDTYPAGGLTEYTYGMYSMLRQFDNAWPYIGIFCITSDDSDKGSYPADNPEMASLDEFTFTASNGLFLGFYRKSFEAINKCNVLLIQAEEFKDKGMISDEEYLLARAEALFLRAYFYFNLVRPFGGVPLVDSVLTDINTWNVPRSSKEEVYALMEEDLLFASENLPGQWDSKFVGRVTKGCADGLLAKVYLYQQKWAPAMQKCQDVINSGFYNLNTSYDIIFTEDGENCSESIFEVQCIYNEQYNKDDLAVYGSQYANVQGLRGTGALDFGWGFNSPSIALLAAYEPDDPRKDASILFMNETTPYSELIDSNKIANKESGAVHPYNQKVYTNPLYRNASGKGRDLWGGWVNIRLLRYADVVLMFTEAANELGQTNEALEKLEWVRARARGGNASVLPEITETDQNALRDIIWHERRIELALEHERFFDLVRWGIAGDVLASYGFITGVHELMPIPQDEIDKSKGILQQNPGY